MRGGVVGRWLPLPDVPVIKAVKDDLRFALLSLIDGCRDGCSGARGCEASRSVVATRDLLPAVEGEEESFSLRGEELEGMITLWP